MASADQDKLSVKHIDYTQTRFHTAVAQAPMGGAVRGSKKVVEKY
jgi:hypothetical protein